MLRTDPRAEEWVARARAVSIEDAAAFVGTRLKRNGTDLAGPCPCGAASKDGFVITPKTGLFVCRPSGEGGGPIDLVMHARACSFVEACEVVTGEPRPSGVKEESPADRAERERKQAERKLALEAQQTKRDEAALTAQERQARQIKKILKDMRPVFGTHADAYIRGRGLMPGAWCDGFGFLPESPYYDNDGIVIARVPVMIAPIVFAPTMEVIGLHRTYLDPDRPVKFRPEDGSAKKIYGRAQGGLIPLGQIGEFVAIGEGIETSIAWAQHPDLGGERDISIAAAVSLGNMSGGCTGTVFPKGGPISPKTGKPIPIPNGIPDMDQPGMILPPQVKKLILLQDGDSEPFMTKARVLCAATRHHAQGIEVWRWPAPDGYDFASWAVAA